MPCLRANSSARSRSRAATAVTIGAPGPAAGFTRAVGAMRAAPKIPILSTQSSGGADPGRGGSETGAPRDVSPVWDGGPAGDGGARRDMSTDANAPGARPTLGHIRGLDGIRALSVLAIIAFHTGLNSVPGGFYGVDSFFVLSGFLITSLLLKEWGGSGTIRLRRFWAGRARRLLPALFLLVAVIGIVLAVVPRSADAAHPRGRRLDDLLLLELVLHPRRGDVLLVVEPAVAPAAHVVAGDRGAVLPGVAARRAGRAEDRHVGGRRVARRASPRAGPPRRARRRPRRRRARRRPAAPRRPAPAEPTRSGRAAGGCTCSSPWPASGSLASAILMAFLAPNGYTTRAYYGTDTRAQALLVGAAIAIGLTLWRDGSGRRWFTRTASVLAIAGVAGTAALWCTTSETSTFAFSGGFLVASLLAGAVVLGCAVAPRSLVVRLLELPPLPQWGRISYGVYLWYWPVLLVHDRAAAALGRLPALPGPGRHHRRHRRPQLRPRRDADPPRRAAAVALVDRRADRRGRRDQRRLRQHAGAGGGDRAPGFPAARRRADARRPRPHGRPSTARRRRRRDARWRRRRPRRTVPSYLRSGAAGGDGHQAGQGPAGRRLRRRLARGRPGEEAKPVRRPDRQRGDARVLALDADADQGPLLHGDTGRAL